jgi:hypothetical protein
LISVGDATAAELSSVLRAEPTARQASADLHMPAMLARSGSATAATER